MKDCVVRFRCSEKDKQIIEALALAEPYADNVSEYLMSLVMDDYKECHFVDISAVLISKKGRSQPKLVGSYLLDSYGRTSMAAYSDMIDKARELFPSWKSSGKSIQLQLDGKDIPAPFPLADFVVIDEELNKQKEEA